MTFRDAEGTRSEIAVTELEAISSSGAGFAWPSEIDKPQEKWDVNFISDPGSRFATDRYGRG